MLNQILESIDINAVIKVIVSAVVIPLIASLTNRARNYISAKHDEVINKQVNEACIYWIDSLTKLVDDAVVATNQTFVDALKKQGSFTEEKWNEAFDRTKTSVINSLSKVAIDTLKGAVGDLDVYLETLIQASVNKNKAPSVTASSELSAAEVSTTPTVVINATNAEITENK